MINKIIGAFSVFLYFANYHICNLIHPDDVAKFWDLKVSIYSLCVILALKYVPYVEKKLGLIESIFISIIINNIIVNYFFDEKYYSYSDLIVIPLIIIVEYAKHYKISFRKYLDSIIGTNNMDRFNH